jgi:hypothetical protein
MINAACAIVVNYDTAVIAVGVNPHGLFCTWGLKTVSE